MADTIFAPATVRGRSALAIIRISGPLAWDAVAALTRMALPKPRQAVVRYLYDSNKEILDEALLLLFQENRSATGERAAELHCHGAPAVVDAVLRVLAALDGLRLAEAGEFSRRALENGTLDLAQIDGLSDLLQAETEGQRRQAMRVFSGAFSDRISKWRSALVHARAMLEASIDFSDEEIPDDLDRTVLDAIDRVSADLLSEIAGANAAERVRDGFEVALIGRPNAGKSTLLNMIADRDVAIISEMAGTTRDVLEVRLDLKGLPVTLLDTAGLRAEPVDMVEKIGIERTRSRAEMADLRIVLLAPGDDADELDMDVRPDDLLIRTMADITGDRAEGAVSGRTGYGVPDLLERIARILAPRAAAASDVIRLRHRLAFVTACEHLAAARDSLISRHDERAAEDLRLATRSLDGVIGRVDVEDLLDEIFAAFCLGK